MNAFLEGKTCISLIKAKFRRQRNGKTSTALEDYAVWTWWADSAGTESPEGSVLACVSMTELRSYGMPDLGKKYKVQGPAINTKTSTSQ